MRFILAAACVLLVGPALGQPADKAVTTNDNDPGARIDGAPRQPRRIDVIPPHWATWRGGYSGVFVAIGDPPSKLMPGGGDYGAVSAVTGAIEIPASADANVIAEGVSGTIVASGVLGVARSSSMRAPAVGVYGGAHMGAPHAQAWGANFTTKNYETSGVPPASGFNGQVYGVEVDMDLVAPASGWAGTNADGLWITGVWPSRVDGQMNALHVGAQGAAGWKNAIKTDHGSASEFAEIGKSARTGASPSQVIHLISSDGRSDFHALIQSEPDGSLSIRPNFYGAPKGLVVAGADPSRFVGLHPVTGITTPSVATRSLLVDLDGRGAKVVSVGPPDSCGKGRRCLSVPN